MARLSAIMEPLSPDSRQRVLCWLASAYSGSHALLVTPATSARQNASSSSLPTDQQLSTPNPPPAVFLTFGEARDVPDYRSKRALVKRAI